MKKIPYLKMQGAGNDFIMLDNRQLKLDPALFPALARRLCCRRLSVGADGLMVADAPEHGGDLKMYFFNSDGSMGEMCGNGARCIGRFGYEHFAAKETVIIEATAGDVPAQRIDKRMYRVHLNKPTRMAQVSLEAQGRSLEGMYVVLGNPGLPHGVFVWDGLKDLDYQGELFSLGRTLRYHPVFGSKGANINFCQVLAPDHVLVRTYERGVEDFTLACGTGSGSTVAALQKLGLVQMGPVRISNPGGDLWVEPVWQEGKVEQLLLTGPTNIVAEGFITDEDLELDLG